MTRSTPWSTSCFITAAWSAGLLLPLTALNEKPSRRAASAPARCCASQYGLFAPCSSQTTFGFCAAGVAAETATTASARSAANATSTLFMRLPPLGLLTLRLRPADDEPAVDPERRPVHVRRLVGREPDDGPRD